MGTIKHSAHKHVVQFYNIYTLYFDYVDLRTYVKLQHIKSKFVCLNVLRFKLIAFKVFKKIFRKNSIFSSLQNDKLPFNISV